MALLDGIVSYWRFNGSSQDVAGGGNNGTDTNIEYTSAAGKIGKGSKEITINTNYISVGTNSNLSNGGVNYSISAWCYSYSTNQQTIFNTIRSSAPLTGIEFLVASGNPRKMRLFTYDNTANNLIAESNTTFSFDNFTWHHLVVTVDGSKNITFYLDGSPDGTATHSCNTMANGTVLIRAGNRTNTNNWYGYVDEVGYWSRALTGDEVAALYNLGNGLGYPFGREKAIPPFPSHNW